MAFVHRHPDGESYAAELRPDADVMLRLLPDSEYGVLMFEDSGSVFHVMVPRSVLPKLASVISWAGLAGPIR